MNFSNSQTFAALRHRNFRLFYTGQMISLTGSWMQALAFSWLVLVLTNSSFYLGLVGALQTLPVLLFSLLGGVVADHTHKLRLLFITQAALMILALVLGVLVELELVKIWDLCLIVFLSGTVMAFDIPVRQAFIVELVGKPDLPNAIALNSTLFNATRVIGPAVAGVLIAVVGMANCFFLNAVSFLAVLLALFLMHLPPAQPATWTPFRKAWREVVDHLLERSELKLVLLIMTAVAILAMPYFVLLPILARDVLGAGPKGFGLISAGSGLGAFLGGLTLARRLQRRPPMPSFLGGLGVFLCGLMGLGLCRNYYLALVFILPGRVRHGDPAVHGQQPAAVECAGRTPGPDHEPVRAHRHGLGAGGQHHLRHRGPLPGPGFHHCRRQPAGRHRRGDYSFQTSGTAASGLHRPGDAAIYRFASHHPAFPGLKGRGKLSGKNPCKSPFSLL